MKKNECKRCGTCCIKGGPVLHSDDLPIIQKNLIRPDQLIVIRKGEPAYNPLTDKVEPASCEMLKIQGKGSSWECLFYNSAAKECSIHANRPLECRLLQCQDTSEILTITGKDCLSRQDIIAEDELIIPLLHAFAEQCSWIEIGVLLTTLSQESIHKAEDILRADLRLREQAVNRLHLSLAQEFFYFGRPMFQAWNNPQLRLVIENGMPRLQPI